MVSCPKRTKFFEWYLISLYTGDVLRTKAALLSAKDRVIQLSMDEVSFYRGILKSFWFQLHTGRYDSNFSYIFKFNTKFELLY